MSPLVFSLVLASASLHALWNFTARKVSGNALVVWYANCISLLLLSVLLFFIESPFTGQSVSAIGWLSLVVTGVLHVAYYLLIGRAYRQGEVSIVYPVARGLGIAMLPVLLWGFFDENLSVQGCLAILLILAGILTIGIPSIRNGKHKFTIPIIIGLTIVAYSLADKTGANAMHPVFYLWGMMAFIVLGQLPWVIRPLVKAASKPWSQFKREIIIIGLADPSAYLIILFCYTLGAASYIIAMREFSVVIASVLGLIFLKEELSWYKVVAITLITAGMITMKLA